MKKVLPLLMALLVLPMLTIAQNSEWEFKNTIPAEMEARTDHAHGLAFGADGNIWVGPYYRFEAAEDDFQSPIYCFTPEGEACEGIEPVIGSATGDSLLRFGLITGMAADHNGDILVYSYGFRHSGTSFGNTRSFIHRIDHQTGESIGVGEVTHVRVPDTGQNHSMHIAADANGFIYYSAVFPGEPVRVLDEDFNFLLNVAEERGGFARTIIVNPEGTRVYNPSDRGITAVYEGDPFSGYELVDTVSFAGMDPGAGVVCPQTGVVYLAASGTGNAPLTDPEKWNGLGIYGFLPGPDGLYEQVDYLEWQQGEGDPFNPIYRAMGMSPDGLHLAVGGFARESGVQLFGRDELLEIKDPEPPVIESNWVFANTLPVEMESRYDNSHGVAIGADGNVWIGPYYRYEAAADDFQSPIYCFTPEGAACEGIEPVIGSATGDSLLRFGLITGMTSDHNGDILVFSYGFRHSGTAFGNTRSFIHRIDHQTGESLGVGEATHVRVPDTGQNHSMHIAADANGFIYYSAVFPGEPVRVLDEDFNFLLNVAEERGGFARTIIVNPEGTRVYNPSDRGITAVYEGDPFSGYELVDTVSFAGMDPGAGAVCPRTGMVYLAASGTGNAPLTDPTRWNGLGIYGFQLGGDGRYHPVEYLEWYQGDGDPMNPVYRSMAISPDGRGIVVGGFARGTGHQYFKRDTPTSIDEPSITELPDGFKLEQNYPNPFNPATTIRYTIPESMDVRIDVYNLAGQRVATLVNEQRNAGVHTAVFDGSQVASGVYIYRITAGTFVETRKMTLIK